MMNEVRNENKKISVMKVPLFFFGKCILCDACIWLLRKQGIDGDTFILHVIY